jgi:hypothetical protein
MPCMDWQPEDKVDRTKEAENRLSAVQKRLNAVTRVACEMGAVLTKDGLLDRLSKSTRKWLEDHNQRDNERRERAKEEVLATLKRHSISVDELNEILKK